MSRLSDNLQREFFFQETVGNIVKNFPTLFEETSENDEEQDGEGTVSRNSRRSGFAQYDILPYILKYCESTNEKFTDALGYSISQVLYVVSYKVIEAKEQEKRLKEIQHKYK